MIASLVTNQPGVSQSSEFSAQNQFGETNVGQVERWLSLAGGGALALFGLTRGSLGGITLGLLGASLLYRGVTGHCSLYSALGVNTAEEATQGQTAGVTAKPDDPSMETSPAYRRF